MKVGVLESKDDAFIKDVLAAIKDMRPEFIRLREFSILDKVDYRVIIDRLSYQHRYIREYLKSASLGGCYVINNPFSSEVNNKAVEMKVCGELGIPFPKTILLPLIGEDDDGSENLSRPDWSKIKNEITFPAIMKPHDGFGWERVYQVESLRDAENVYDALRDKYILMLQEKINYREYYRAYCIGKKDVLFVKYNPAPHGLGTYVHASLDPIKDTVGQLEEWTVKMNSRIDFDFNSVEWCIDLEGTPFIIDAFNEVPDIDKRAFPQEEYEWIIGHLSNLVREKFNNKDVNKAL